MATITQSKNPAFATIIRSLPVAQSLFLVCVALILALFVVPVGPWLLDTLIAISLGASLLLFFTAITVRKPLDFATFPSLLLFSTALRLAISLASAKLIFQDAHAGKIIDAFGNLIAAGNVVKGAVIYLMIFIVSFLVISKGTERAAEVSARFTLDAMPGKQMSIDADLRAGLISGDQARHLRAELGRESSLHGAMDGAMKFVKGDAIAGVLIVLISALGGMAFGVGMLDMSWGEAATRFTVLSIGEGMVSQLSSLIVSLAASALITRITSGDAAGTNIGSDIGKEMVRYPQALGITGAVMFVMGVLPGFPVFPFFAMGLIMAGSSLVIVRQGLAATRAAAVPMPSMQREGTRSTPLFGGTTVPVGGIVMLLSKALSPELSAHQFNIALAKARQAMDERLGLPFPGLSVQFDDVVTDRQYKILSQGVLLDQGSCATRNTAPTNKNTNQLSVVLGNDLAQVIPPDVSKWSVEWELASRIIYVICTNSGRFLGLQETQNIVTQLATTHPDLVVELQREVQATRIAEVLRRLTAEGVTIKPFRDIAESLINWAPREREVIALVELVRMDLGLHMAQRWRDADGSIYAVVLDPQLEELLRTNIRQSTLGVFLALDPQRAKQITSDIALAYANAKDIKPNVSIAVCCSYDVRRHVSKLIEKSMLNVPVLSIQEIGQHANIVAVKVVDHAPLEEAM